MGDGKGRVNALWPVAIEQGEGNEYDPFQKAL